MTTTHTPVAPVAPSSSRLRPLGVDEVTITGGFWGRRQDINGSATLAHIKGFLDSEGWLRNFDLVAGGGISAGRRGREFSDSEAYKYLEAAAWELARRPDPQLEATFTETVARIGAAQDPDGYLHTNFGHEDQPARWTDLEWGHELYCMGHLMQAAVARGRTAPGADDGLVAIATRAADLICDTFGPDGIPSICGHAEIELGLTELARLTGDARYARQAKLFVDRHGDGTLADIEWGRAYFQDDVALRDATALRGHAVRANYLAAGAVDAAVETGDGALVDALRAQWARTAERRTYVTGGQGSRHQDEAFGDDWVLPPDRAYSETCAGIASAMFSWRLLLDSPATEYADLIERTWYNVLATSPAADGTAFFYANTLHQRVPGTVAAPDEVSPRALSSLRAPWFEVSCCPPNVARTLASLASYVATADGEGIQVHQFAPCRIETVVGANRVRVDVETAYPDDGTITVTVVEAPAEGVALSLRVPAWADGATLTTADGTVAAAPGTYAEPSAPLAKGAVAVLDLPVSPRFTTPDPRIDAVRGTVAIERGPVVYCIESVDLEAAGISARDDDLSLIRIDPSAGVALDDGEVVASVLREAEPEHGWPYRTSAPSGEAPGAARRVRMTPYHSWANRGPSTMRVWIPTA
ncbi:beta-L-arabinofuranosidase domain-containing protein [Demequina sp. NBRC 110056]|uniref:glycoside hydrolase family 127 protein n=1 Tax=Demequina sp. NBRC 110056 TaxID=1570345 RepID=UPI000A0614CE